MSESVIEKENLNGHQLILYDGNCYLCHASVRFIIRHDRKDHFLFAAQKSKIGNRIAHQYRIDKDDTNSVLLYTPSKGTIDSKSTAALLIAKHLNFPYNILYSLILIPKVIRHWFYDIIAKNRYRWFGKKEHCELPNPSLKHKFLE